MPYPATARAPESEIVGRLAKFFPQATPVRIPIKLSRSGSLPTGSGANSNNPAAQLGAQNGKSTGAQASATVQSAKPQSENVFFQNTVIEFGTPHEVLFVVDRPLEFADRVLVESNDGSLHAEASVVAVQYHPKQTVVAARFLQNVPNWIVKS